MKNIKLYFRLETFKKYAIFACYSYIICVVSDGFRVEQATGSKKDLFAHSPGNLSQIFLSQVKC